MNRAEQGITVDVWRITIAALRRWYILFPLLALTGWGVLAAGERVEPEYEVTGAAMFTPFRVEPDMPNPYGDVDAANRAVVIVLRSPAIREQIADMGLISSYEVEPEQQSSIMYLTVRGDSPEVAERTGTAVFELARQELANRQDAVDLPAQGQYGLEVLDAPSVNAIVQDGKTRIQAVVGVLGAGMALVAAVLFDDIVGLLRRVRDRRRAEQAGDTDDSGTDEPSVD
ncbi:MAG TPA: hypothetical protein VK053_07925, partial [Jiangellaceae bacterium]|nr:hypothetical protein [Jiangellaceae bacterium]